MTSGTTLGILEPISLIYTYMHGARPIVLRMTCDPVPSVGESGGFRFVWCVLAFFSVIIVVLSWASSTDVAVLMSVMLLVSGLAQAIRAS